MEKTQGLFRLPDSGQDRCYDGRGNEIDRPGQGDNLYGQDGCFAVNPMTYVKLDAAARVLPASATWADGYRVLRDENTGLVWEVKSPQAGDVNFAGDEYNWQAAQSEYIPRLNASRYGGHDDWRLPNRDELRSIVDYGRCDPAVDPLFFPHCRVDFYWSAVTYEMQPYFAWGIFFGLGSGIAYGKQRPGFVRAVRGGHCDSFGHADRRRFVDHGDGTVTDLDTRLMWQQGENERMSWFEALRFCQQMRLAGHADWRLPNIRELNSILNLTYKDGWWYHKDFFPAAGLEPPLLHYFSSTSFQSTYAWVTNFCFGYDGYYASKNATLLFRAVRNPQPLEQSATRFRLPDSGQRICYDDEGRRITTCRPGERFFGQDGCHEIHPPAYTKLGDGGAPLDAAATWAAGCRCVRDENTGLIWEQKSPAPVDINFAGDTYTWQEAQDDYIARLNQTRYGGYGDWRLPNREELRSIVDYAGQTPAVDVRYFPHCRPAFYWSHDAYAADEAMKWGIYFAYGCAICYREGNRYHVRAVRGGHQRDFGDPRRYAFTDNGDGTVKDCVTGLMWKRDESPDLNWEEALHYCETLELAGHRDWRLPGMKELATILDLARTDGVWFHRRFFPNAKTAPLGFYWASTTHGESFGWGVNFQFGYDGYYAGKKHGRYPFRPVRSVSHEE